MWVKLLQLLRAISMTKKSGKRAIMHLQLKGDGRGGVAKCQSDILGRNTLMIMSSSSKLTCDSADDHDDDDDDEGEGFVFY